MGFPAPGDGWFGFAGAGVGCLLGVGKGCGLVGASSGVGVERGVGSCVGVLSGVGDGCGSSVFSFG
jgi:hypothetical protein